MNNSFQEGRKAGEGGTPSSANPYPKPDGPETGEAYPGDWALWMSGWCWGAERYKRCTVNERAELHEFTMKGVGYVGQ